MANKYRLAEGYYAGHSVIARLIGKSKTVLDVGCNEGYLGRAADMSNQFFGIDFAKPAVAQAKKSYEGAYVYDLNRLTPLVWKRQKYDVIVFADVLEHLIDPVSTLRFFTKNYLKQNGRIIISLPNIANWQIRLQLLTGSFTYTQTGILDRTHLHFYTYISSQQLLAAAGLHCTKVQFGSTLFGPLIAVLPWLKGLLATNIILEGIMQI